MTIRTATATREGTTAPNCDAAAVFEAINGTVAAVLIDGTGHSDQLAAGVERLAWAGARLAARTDGRAALVTLGATVADPGAAAEPEPDGPAVTAVWHPEGDVVVHWIGDCRAYAWDGARLVQLTSDHTMGEYLRTVIGRPVPESRPYDAWILTTLSRALPTMVCEVVAEQPQLVLLTTDGIHDAVPHSLVEALVRQHADNPQALANALVAAVPADVDGYRDDATAVIVTTAD